MASHWGRGGVGEGVTVCICAESCGLRRRQVTKRSSSSERSLNYNHAAIDVRIEMKIELRVYTVIYSSMVLHDCM